MKSVLLTIPLWAGLLFLGTGCEKDVTEHGKAPASIGTISLNRTRIGAGQPVIATCALPTGGENIASVSYTWNTDNGLEMEGQSDNSKSTFSFTASSTPGEHQLTFKASYIFTAPNLEGNVSQELSTTLKYTVTACDALNSFWGDNLEETRLNRPSLEQTEDHIYSGMYPDQFSTNTLNPPLILTSYTFSNDQLIRISEIESFEGSTPASYTLKYLWLRASITKLLGVEPSSQTIFWKGTQQTETFDPNGDDAYKTQIGEGIMNGQLEIVSIFHGQKTDMRLEVFTGSNNAIEYMRTYEKAGSM